MIIKSMWLGFGLISIICCSVGITLSVVLGMRAGTQKLAQDTYPNLDSILYFTTEIVELHLADTKYLASVLPSSNNISSFLTTFLAFHPQSQRLEYWSGDLNFAVYRDGGGQVITEYIKTFPRLSSNISQCNFNSSGTLRCLAKHLDGLVTHLVTVDPWIRYITYANRKFGIQFSLLNNQDVNILTGDRINHISRINEEDRGYVYNSDLVIWMTTTIGPDRMVLLSERSPNDIRDSSGIHISCGITSSAFIISIIALIFLTTYQFQQAKLFNDQQNYITSLAQSIILMDLDEMPPPNIQWQLAPILTNIIEAISNYRMFIPDCVRETTKQIPTIVESPVVENPLTKIERTPEGKLLKPNIKTTITTFNNKVETPPIFTDISHSPTRTGSLPSSTSSYSRRTPKLHVNSKPEGKGSSSRGSLASSPVVYLDSDLTLTNVTTMMINLSEFSSPTFINALRPEHITQMYNEYITLVENTLKKSSGQLHGFINEQIVVSWNVSSPCAQHEIKACGVALLLIDELYHCLVNWELRGWPTPRSYVSICSGRAMVGAAGSHSTKTMAIIGPHFKRLKLLNELAKDLNARIIIDEHTNIEAQYGYITRQVDTLEVYQDGMMNAFELIKHEDNPSSMEWMYLIDVKDKANPYRLYTQAFNLFLDKQYAPALSLIQQYTQQAPTDEIAQRLERILNSRDQIGNIPSQYYRQLKFICSWNYVNTLKSSDSPSATNSIPLPNSIRKPSPFDSSSISTPSSRTTSHRNSESRY